VSLLSLFVLYPILPRGGGNVENGLAALKIVSLRHKYWVCPIYLIVSCLLCLEDEALHKLRKEKMEEKLRRKAGSGIMLALLLIGMMTWAFYYPLTSAQNSLSEQEFVEQEIVALVNGLRAYNYDLELENIAFRHYAFRSGGSAGASEAANWIKGQFEGFGLEAWLEPFEFTTWDLLSQPSLIIDEDGNQGTTSDQTMIPSFQCEYFSWPTPQEGAFADLVVLPLPEAANLSEIGKNPINMTAWGAINATGKIVLIGKEVHWDPNWASEFYDKLKNQPPAAVVHTWWYDWMSFAGPERLGSRYYRSLEIPAGFISYEDGLWIRNRENTMNVSAHVSAISVTSKTTHYNVIGKIKGYKNPEKIIIISGHYDTVMCGGFCDNGAGTAGVVELAKVFADAAEAGFYRPRYTLLFVAFASEEMGLVGSINYVRQHKSEMANISAVINLDCIGSDDLFFTETNPVNGFDLDEIILNAAKDLGVNAALTLGGGSDHETFRNPSWANQYYWLLWGLEANISDATPVESSALLVSYPLFYDEKWSGGTPGWIHTSYDNSTSTETLNWVEVEDLENHIKVAALTTMRISLKAGDFGTIVGGYYDFDDKCDYQDLFLFRKAYVEAYHLLCDFDNDHDVDYLDLFQFRKCYINPDP